MPLIHHFVPYHESAGQNTTTKFGGLLKTEFLEPPPGRCFQFRQTYRHDVEGPCSETLRKLIDSPLRPKGPYPHLHKYQTEYFRVESGILGIQVEGEYRKYTPADGEFTVNAGTIHQFRIDPDSPEEMTVILSASDAGMDRQLDRVYFENWYGYWHDCMLHEGGKMNLFQYLAIHDGGDVYTLPPKWVPFRKFFAYWGTIVLGRWIGGLLGYRPYFKEYTTDWDYAVAKMKGSWFQRHLVDESYSKALSWEDQVAVDRATVDKNAAAQRFKDAAARKVNGSSREEL